VDGVVAVLLLGASFAAFLGVAVLVIVTPGPDTALTIRNSLLGGRRDGVFTALGVSTGQCAWAIATSAGIAALLVASEPAFVALRVFGAAYLVFLGVRVVVVGAPARTEARRLWPFGKD
jgi:threonine/homoserine/homoserine lactone efflux protein